MNQFHSLIAMNHQTIELCGCDPTDISSWAREPWTYPNIRNAHKWFTSFMTPVIDELSGFIKRFPSGYFTLLGSVSHPDTITLNQKKRAVREMWFKRPRYKDDKGRSGGGY